MPPASIKQLQLLIFLRIRAVSWALPHASGVATGTGTLTLTNWLGLTVTSPIQVGVVSPGEFTADASGAELAAGTTDTALVANCSASGCTANPIDLSNADDKVY